MRQSIPVLTFVNLYHFQSKTQIITLFSYMDMQPKK